MKRMLVSALCVFGLLSSQLSQAGSEGVGTAKGITIGEIMYEKCTGIKPPKNQQQKIITALRAQGYSDQDINQGLAEAVAYAEFGRPPGKPSRSECRDSTQIHKLTLSFIQ